MVPPDASRDLRFRCSHCDKAFGRSEHLRRHELIHQEDRPFKCHFCTKDFIRRDALQRHESTHNALPSLLQKGGRACSQCATAKARCSGEQVCSRCGDRGLQCAYPLPNAVAAAPQMPPSTVVHAPIGPIPPAPSQRSQFHVQQGTVLQPHMSMQGPTMPDAGLMGFDLWDQNVLSSSNWLDVLDPADLSQFPFDNFSAFNSPFPNRPPQLGVQFQPSSVPLHSPDRIPDARSQVQTDSPASVFSAQSNAVTDSITSQGTYENSPSKPGEYYVDGEPARLPRVKRRKLSTATKRSVDLRASTDTYSLALRPGPQTESESSVQIPHSIYEELQSWYQRLCIEAPAPWMTFAQVPLPGQDLLERLLGLYFKHFDQTVPIVHGGLFHETSCEYLQVIAMASLGSHYLGEAYSAVFTSSMHEMTRRCVLYVRERSADGADFTMSRMSAELLHVLGAAFCGHKHLLRFALGQRSWLAEIHKECKRQFNRGTVSGSGSTDHSAWAEWARQQAFIRLGNAAWLLDCELSYQFLEKPVLTLKDASLPLPCPDKLWTAPSPQHWRSLNASNSSQPNLIQALQEIYVEKKLSPEVGEFARIVIIHGLYQRLWEVERYYEDPLSQWIPTANRQSTDELLPKVPIWLPSIPTFNKWQNSACDALDILHWQANATIGQASGLEHPTVLHLHLARIILLTPYSQMVELSRAMIDGTSQTESAKMNQQLIQRWAIQHQYKARLAIIHAGVVFWHVRRYSIDAFHEAPAVGLAALVLWAFGTFFNHKVRSRSASRPVSGDKTPSQPVEQGLRERSPESDDARCEIILLDRPTDDELVQQFIRNGHNMRAHLTGVGDLYAARGPERALSQGCKLLTSLRCWGVSDTWLHLLQSLLDVSQKHRGTG